MYGAAGTTSVGAAGATTLAITGANTFWVGVTGMALVMLGVMITRLTPKKEF